MLRDAAGKAAWVGRTASMVFGLALVMALLFGAASVGLAANGQPFLLGKAKNAATRVTVLVGEVAGKPALRVTNPSGGPALGLKANAGQAPLRVNVTAGTAANLSADELDGKDSSDFLGKTEKAADADRLDGKDSTELAPILRAQQRATGGAGIATGPRQVNSVSIDAPVSGVLVISGTAFVRNFHTGAVDYLLVPKVDGSSVTMAGWGDYFAANGPTSDQGDDGGLSYTLSEPVGAGEHTVTQDLVPNGQSDASFGYNNTELSVQFVPGAQASVDTAGTTAKAASGEMSPTGE